MKLLGLVSLVSGSLLAQTVTPPNPLAETFFEITGSQTATIINSGLLTYPSPSDLFPDLRSRFGMHLPSPVPHGSESYPYAATSPAIAPFYSQFPGGEATYNPQTRSSQPDLTTVQPAPPPDLQLIFLDAGGSHSLVAIDLTNPAVIGQVVVPSIAGPFGIRPSATGAANEVWSANQGLEISVVDLGSQTLLANILTPSVPQAVAPAGIVFTNAGATALEAVGYYSPDSAGNNGALLTIDAVGRTVTSTLQLKYVPTAIVVSPDGLTAYILSEGERLPITTSSAARRTSPCRPTGQD